MQNKKSLTRRDRCIAFDLRPWSRSRRIWRDIFILTQAFGRNWERMIVVKQTTRKIFLLYIDAASFGLRGLFLFIFWQNFEFICIEILLFTSWPDRRSVLRTFKCMQLQWMFSEVIRTFFFIFICFEKY